VGGYIQTFAKRNDDISGQGNFKMVDFKYERLSTFCFLSGKIGHVDKDCNG